MKWMKGKFSGYLIVFSLLLCLALTVENLTAGVWSADPFAQTVEAKKNKKKNNNSRNSSVNTASNTETDQKNVQETEQKTEQLLDEKGSYTSKEDVALYIHQYGKLPGNYITKKEAQKLGWSGGSLEPYAPGKSIGGSRFGNYEELLPIKVGRNYYECDIDTLGAKSRGAKRIVYSDDGLIYYTGDHYATFELLYGEEILENETK